MGRRRLPAPGRRILDRRRRLHGRRDRRDRLRLLQD